MPSAVPGPCTAIGKLPVDAVLGQEFLVSAALAQLAFVHHKNAIGALYSAQHQDIPHNRDQPGGEQIVQHVHVGGDAGHQAATGLRS